MDVRRGHLLGRWRQGSAMIGLRHAADRSGVLDRVAGSPGSRLRQASNTVLLPSFLPEALGEVRGEKGMTLVPEKDPGLMTFIRGRPGPGA